MELTIEITNFCEAGCEYCSTNAVSDRNKAFFLTLEEIVNYLRKFKYIKRINISGGEPLAHPDFYNILKLCEATCGDVRVYTNSIKHIMYNTDIIKEVIVEANVCMQPGRSVYIPKNANQVHLLQLTNSGRAKNMKKQKFHVSSNMLEEGCGRQCDSCNNSLLQADGQIVPAPCKKDY